MQSFNIDFAKDGIFFVDIGYHGTMQDMIFKFYDEKIKITGFFIKCRSKTSENNQKIGLLADVNNKKLFGSKVLQYDAYNYEQILRADHGRCLGYELTKNNTAKVLLDTEHDDKEIYDKYVKPLQADILIKFNKISKLALADNSDIATLATIYYFKTIKNKTNLDFKWI